MKIDVTMTQTPEDLSLTGKPKCAISLSDEPMTRLRRWGVNCRLAEQIEAEQVVLSSDMEEARLKLESAWTEGRRQPESNRHDDFSTEMSRQFGNKLDGGVVADGDELDWTRTSDDDCSSPAAEVGTDEDFRNAMRNLETGTVDCSRYSEKAGAISPNTTQEAELCRKGPDASLSSSPMETDISSFFPTSRNTVERSFEALSSKIQGLSPRQRLLYRYQLEELMMNGNQMEDSSAGIPDGSALSISPGPSPDARLDGVSSPGYAEPPESPNSWKTTKCDDEAGGPEELSLHPVPGLLRGCHICGYAPHSREDYDAHMKKTHFTHKCRLCIYWSRSPGRLNRHMKNFHSEPGDTPANKKPKNPRKYTCKQCEFFTYIQEEIWNHTRVHVPASKLLSCPHCPFVCAFKHHMQYHMNNHLGYKPFKCSECNYRCNNKSMLNSHKKSHSNDYPFRCGVCNYAAKYRHALNIHLRKKKHIADGEVVLDERQRLGRTTRNRCNSTSRSRAAAQELPSPPSLGHAVPDEAGRGISWPETQIGRVMDFDAVKQDPERMNLSMTSPYSQIRHQSAYSLSVAKMQPPLIPISELPRVQPLHYSPFMNGGPLPSLTAPLAQNHSDAKIGNGAMPQAAPIPVISSLSSLGQQHHCSFQETNHLYGVFPSNKQIPTRSSYHTTVHENQEHENPALSSPAHYLNETIQDFNNDSEDEWPLDLTAKSNEDKDLANKRRKSWEPSGESPQLDWYECQHCGIIFPDRILYSMHMEYHSHADPFHCKLCGQRTKDRSEFFNHISQVAHN